MYSNTLQQDEVRDIGLLLEGLLQLFFLKMGQIFAFRQSDGKFPVLSNCVKMTCKIGEISAAQCFNIM